MQFTAVHSSTPARRVEVKTFKLYSQRAKALMIDINIPCILMNKYDIYCETWNIKKENFIKLMLLLGNIVHYFNG